MSTVSFGGNFQYDTATGLVLATHLAVGSGAAISANTALVINETISSGSVNVGIDLAFGSTASGASASVYGINSVLYASQTSTAGNAVGILSGITFGASANFAGIASSISCYAQSSVSQTGTLAGIALQSFYIGTFSGSKPTSMYGTYIQNLGHSGITNTYGIYILAQSGSTNNYGFISLSAKNGIGTATPNASLEIIGAGATASTTSFYAQNSVGTGYLKFGDSGILEHRAVNAAYNFISYQPNGTIAFQFYTANAGNEFQLFHSGTEKFVIRGTGDSYFNTGGRLTIGSTTTVTSALLNIDSTTGTILIPRMTTNGMIVYDSTLGKFQGYEAGAWTSFI